MNNGFDTIIILANALRKASAYDILRMDVQYNSVIECYSARVWLGDVGDPDENLLIYDISEDGQINRI